MAQATIDQNGNRHSVPRNENVDGFGDVEWMPLMTGWSNGDFGYGGLSNV